MMDYFTAICPQCRKRLDEAPNVEDSTAAEEAVSRRQLEGDDVCKSELDEVRARPDQDIDTVI